jgi:hypothetical protein
VKDPGPIRLRPRGPRRPAPAAPPVVEVLPPVERSAFAMPAPLAAAAAAFDRGDYRGCVDPLEELFFARRNTLHQAAIQYVVALHQLRLGMARSPRRLLERVLALLEPYEEWSHGIDVAALRTHATAVLARLDDRSDPGFSSETSPSTLTAERSDASGEPAVARAAWLDPPPLLAIP